jgi:putative sterol carrier protein
MSERDATETEARILERFRRLPFFSDFSAPLPRLAQPDSYDFDATFARLAQLVGTSQEALSVRFHLADGDAVRSWSVDAGPEGGQVTTEEPARPPGIELILDAETWKLIAEGTLTPLEAFGRGRMRVRGDIDVYRRFARRLELPDGGRG